MDHEQWLEHHDRMMGDFDARQSKLQASQEKLEASQEKTERTLRRAIRLSILDARRQRKRNLEFEDKMTQLASALTAFLERGGNGKP